ncbi:MAG TPA: isoprenyl transferase [bacterium]|nr:isoprenyl transferase [bacterium]
MTGSELELKEAIRKAGGLPRHVAIIMDGNGRWAKSRGLPRLAGHRAGVEPVRTTVRAAAELGLEVLTLYAFSVENWNRPRIEINGLMQVLKDTLRREQDELNENGVRLRTIGREQDLPPDVRIQIDKTRQALEHNRGLILNLALSYGGRAEIVDATKRMLADVQRKELTPEGITEEKLSQYMYSPDLPDPDLLIRTSGELRVSNFLLWQIAYAEIWVTPTHWPDFGREHFYRAIREFQCRDRRFGRTESASPPPARMLAPTDGPG